MKAARLALTVTAVAVCPFLTAATLVYVALDRINAHLHDRRLQALADEVASWTTDRSTA